MTDILDDHIASGRLAHPGWYAPVVGGVFSAQQVEPQATFDEVANGCKVGRIACCCDDCFGLRLDRGCGLVFFVIALAIDLLYAAGSGWLGHWLKSRPGLVRRQERIVGLIYLSLAALTAAQGTRTSAAS